MKLTVSDQDFHKNTEKGLEYFDWIFMVEEKIIFI